MHARTRTTGIRRPPGCAAPHRSDSDSGSHERETTKQKRKRRQTGGRTDGHQYQHQHKHPAIPFQYDTTTRVASTDRQTDTQPLANRPRPTPICHPSPLRTTAKRHWSLVSVTSHWSAKRALPFPIPTKPPTPTPCSPPRTGRGCWGHGVLGPKRLGDPDDGPSGGCVEIRAVAAAVAAAVESVMMMP